MTIGYRNYIENAKEQKERQGPMYKRWLKGCLNSLSKQQEFYMSELERLENDERSSERSTEKI